MSADILLTKFIADTLQNLFWIGLTVRIW